MDLTNSIANFREVMGFDAGNEVIYEDAEDDESIPRIQVCLSYCSLFYAFGKYKFSE